MHLPGRPASRIALVSIAIVAVTPESALSQVCSVSELHKLSPEGVRPGGSFAMSFAFAGDWAIAGESDSGLAGWTSGAAHIFRRDHAGAPGTSDEDTWVEVQTLVAEDAAPRQYFGVTVAISGHWAAVAAKSGVAPGDDEGSVYLYRRDDNATPTETADDRWAFHEKLTAPDGERFDQFGSSLALSDEWLVVGAPGDAPSSWWHFVGAAYVYMRRSHDTPGERSDDRWILDSKLRASDGQDSDWFGTSVSISYPWIVVGTPKDDYPAMDSGSAYVFRRDMSGLDDARPWAEVATLSIPDAPPTSYFGDSVSIDGGVIVIGAPLSDVAEERGGAAYVFELDQRWGPTDPLRNPWRLTGRLLAPDADVQARFGKAVAVHGDWVVVSAPYDDDRGDDTGAAYVFGRNDNGTAEDTPGDSWVVIDKLKASDGFVNGRVGQSLTIDGETVAAGSYGAAYIFPFHTEEPYCGDACCNGNENCTNCPEDCFGCGDHCCTGAENFCSCPHDCPRTICGDGCLSGDEDCVLCPADCPEFFSLDVPGLEGGYACAWGQCIREQEFQFPVRFLSVHEAWLHVSGRASDEYCEPTDHHLHSLVDSVSCRDDVIATSSELPFEADVPVSPTSNVYDGQGVIGLFLDTWSHGCWDNGSTVTDATLWLSAVPSPPAASLRDVAELQCCYSGSSVVAEPQCRHFDHDADKDVDLADFRRFRMALEGP